jgi:hypothetical protein
MNDPIDDLRRYARDLESEVGTTRSEIRARQAIETVRHAPRRPRRTVVVVATTVIMGLGNTALAAAANPAVPGDLLYGVDRAYEQVGDVFGIGGTHVGERFDEAGELIERGRSADALALVQEILQGILDSDDPQAAVDELIGQGQADVAARVRELVQFARDLETENLSFESVRDAANSLVTLVEPPDHAQGDPGRPDSTPVGPPDDTPAGPPTAPSGNPDPGPPSP